MIDENRRTSFGKVAEKYDKVRPGYPLAVFERLKEHTSQFPEVRALEIGAGTGQASLSFLAANKPASLVCLEPQASLSELLKNKTSPELSVWTTTCSKNTSFYRSALALAGAYS